MLGAPAVEQARQIYSPAQSGCEAYHLIRICAHKCSASYALIKDCNKIYRLLIKKKIRTNKSLPLSGKGDRDSGG